jgi:hypothetical protein
MQVALRRRAAHNGLELSCRASRIRFRIGRFSAAGPVSCSELFGRPDPPLQARELGSNRAEPSICHPYPKSERPPFH